MVCMTEAWQASLVVLLSPHAIRWAAAGRGPLGVPGRHNGVVRDRLDVSRTGQRVAAYGVIRDAADRLLLVQDAVTGRWFLPGGGVRYAEHPEQAVLREVAEETGLPASVIRLRAVTSDVTALESASVTLHSIRIVYDVQIADGDQRLETDGSSVRAGWYAPDQLATLPLQPFVAEVLRPPR
jgi:8-oxo-dGTP diphosphatase